MRITFRQVLLRFPGFPCLGCGSDEVEGLNSFCAECVEKLPLIHEPRCPGCGGRLDGVLELCGKCLNLPSRPWRRAVSVLEFRDSGRDLVLRFKNGTPELARPLAELSWRWLRQPDFAADGIVPVPLHWWRQWRRGFNQAELLAGELGRHLGIPCLQALRRVKSAGHQASRSREGRLAAMRGVFAPNPKLPVAGLRLWLVDDILTTGATLAAACRELQHAGAAEVRIFALARR